MYFFVDESGHTGTNLFDENQPSLYYGVLVCETNLDAVAEGPVVKARRLLGVQRVHASEIGIGGLIKISEQLIYIQKKYKPRFDLCRVAKPDHAVICFFDQVFDQGMNPAITWSGYWTPLRYMLLAKVAALFDEDLAKRAWEARIDTHDRSSTRELCYVCRALISKLSFLPDARSRQLIGDALNWAAENPRALNYNCRSSNEVLAITPNLIGFQTVMHGIAARLKNRRASASVTVDQQSQFNKAQRTLAEFYASARDVPWVSGPGMPKMDLSKMPTVPIVFKSGLESAGLELVDCYLWIFKRLVEGKDVPEELYPLIRAQLHRGRTDEISINSIVARWSKWFENLGDPSPEQTEAAKAIRDSEEERRLRAMQPAAQD